MIVAIWLSAREVLHETVVDVASDYRSPTAMLHCVDQFSHERPDIQIDVIVTSERVGYNDTSGAALLGQQFADKLDPEMVVIGAYEAARPFGVPRGATPVKVPASGVPEARAQAAVVAIPDDVLLILNRARRLTVSRRPWTPPPFSPGLDGSDSLDRKEMASALPWWLSQNGYLRDSLEEYQGQGRWYPVSRSCEARVAPRRSLSRDLPLVCDPTGSKGGIDLGLEEEDAEADAVAGHY